MIRYAIRRTLGALPRVLLVSLLLFLMLQLPAGGPADVFAADPNASPEAIQRIEELWGLNRPVHEQYLSWLGNMVRGDWGFSFGERRPARDVVLERLGNTLWLTGGALLVGLLLGVALGFLLPFLTPALIKGASGLFGSISITNDQTMIWTISAWAFLPASLFMRGIAMQRVATLICEQRARNSASAESKSLQPA